MLFKEKRQSNLIKWEKIFKVVLISHIFFLKSFDKERKSIQSRINDADSRTETILLQKVKLFG
jgi:hypothetical protein